MSAVFWNLTIAVLITGMATVGPGAGGDWWLMTALLTAASVGLVAGQAVFGRVSLRSFGLLALGAAVLTGGRLLPSSNAVAVAAALIAALVWASTRRRTDRGSSDHGRGVCPACRRPTLEGLGGPDRRGWTRARCPGCRTNLRTGWPAHAGLVPVLAALGAAPFADSRYLAAGFLLSGLAAVGITRLVWPHWRTETAQRSH